MHGHLNVKYVDIFYCYMTLIILFHTGWPTNEPGHPVLLHPHTTWHQRQTRVLERRTSSIQSRLQQGAQESKWLQNIFFSVGLSRVGVVAGGGEEGGECHCPPDSRVQGTVKGTT